MLNKLLALVLFVGCGDETPDVNIYLEEPPSPDAGLGFEEDDYSPPPVCEAGLTQTCPCFDNRVWGIQKCDLDGSHWFACECPEAPEEEFTCHSDEQCRDLGWPFGCYGEGPDSDAFGPENVWCKSGRCTGEPVNCKIGCEDGKCIDEPPCIDECEEGPKFCGMDGDAFGKLAICLRNAESGCMQIVIVEDCILGCFGDDDGAYCGRCAHDWDCPMAEPECFDCESGDYRSCITIAEQTCRGGLCGNDPPSETCKWGPCVRATEGESAHCPPPVCIPAYEFAPDYEFCRNAGHDDEWVANDDDCDGELDEGCQRCQTDDECQDGDVERRCIRYQGGVHHFTVYEVGKCYNGACGRYPNLEECANGCNADGCIPVPPN